MPKTKESFTLKLLFLTVAVCLVSLTQANTANAETVIFFNIETNARKDTSTTIQYDTDIAATGQI